MSKPPPGAVALQIRALREAKYERLHKTKPAKPKKAQKPK